MYNDNGDVDGGGDVRYAAAEEEETGKYISSGEYRKLCDRNLSSS